MENTVKTFRYMRKGFGPYLLTALAVAFCYALFAPILNASEDTIRMLMRFAALLTVFTLAALALFKKLTLERFVLAVVILGIALRIGYMLYTPYALRGHDIDDLDQAGHYAYMYNLFTTGKLPDSYGNQFYHPPFEHILQVLVAKVFSIFQPDTPIDKLFECTKIVPCFASSAIIFVTYRICQETKLSGTATAITTAIIAFQPVFYLLSASVNNDCVMLLLFMVSLLYTIRWYYNPSMKNILTIAFAIGFSMMTKLSGGMIALFTGPVMLIVFYKWFKEKKGLKALGQFGAFIGVCAPLGLWYSIRNFVKFHQPFGYVPEIGRDSDLFCGNRTFMERFGSLPLKDLFNPYYCHARGDYNLWVYVLKSSIFGEYTFEQSDFLAKLLIITNLIMVIGSLVAMIYVMVRCGEVNVFVRFGLFFIGLVQILSFISFNIGFPFGCTMDFRYIMPTCIVGAVYLGAALDHIRKKGKTLPKGIFVAGCVVISAFALASILFYTV